MNTIVCPITFIPIRKEPSHRSEQVSQLIFGETATIIGKEDEWIFVKTQFDEYEGWIETKVASNYKKEAYEIIAYKSALLQQANGGSLFIPVGSQISFNKSKKMVLGNDIFDIGLNDFSSVPDLIEIIQEFIGAPYLWGGRTPYGADCSGFTQIVMKCMGLNLPRDAWQQAKLGREVVLNEARQGDLAFFGATEANITHVGIVLKNNQIVHSSGYVRVDKIDVKGIFNETTKKHSHTLCVIKTYR